MVQDWPGQVDWPNRLRRPVQDILEEAGIKLNGSPTASSSESCTTAGNSRDMILADESEVGRVISVSTFDGAALASATSRVLEVAHALRSFTWPAR